jgi:hypothetical protein
MLQQKRKFTCASAGCIKIYASQQSRSKHYRSYPTHRHVDLIKRVTTALFNIKDIAANDKGQKKDYVKLIGFPFWKDGSKLVFPAMRAILQCLGLPSKSGLFRLGGQARKYLDNNFLVVNIIHFTIKTTYGPKKQSTIVKTGTLEEILNHGRVIEAMYLRPKSSTSRLCASSVMHLGISAMAGDLAVCKTVSDMSDQLSGTTSIMTRTSFPDNQVPSTDNISNIHGSIAAQQALDNPNQLKEKNSIASSVEFINGSYTITSKWLSRIVLEMDAAAEPQEESHNSGLVYFIRLGETSLVKVGMTGNIEQRIRTLQCGSPFELNIEYTIQTGQPRLMESMMHRTLTKMGLHVRGEWFSLIAGFGHIDLYLQTKMLMKYKN